MRILLCLLSLLLLGPAWGQRPDVVRQVRAALGAGDLAGAERLAAGYRSTSGIDRPYLEALSWIGRGKLAAKQYGAADQVSAEVRKLALAEMERKPLDAESSLPLALGASIEVHAEVLDQQGQKAEAIAFLREELARWRSTSMRARIQKNLNLLNLEGHSALALDVSEYLGQQPRPLPRYRGQPILLFFWAHWCPECKEEGPVIARLMQEFGPQGLVVLAPTQRYGYTGRGEDASRTEETAYIGQVWAQFYPTLSAVPIPVNEENFRVYGASTTPTLVLIDRAGIVRLYHPGTMSYEELQPRVRAVTAGH